MVRDRGLAGQVCATMVALGIVAQWVTSARADTSVPVTGWLHYHSITSADTDNVFDSATNSPTFDDGTAGNANDETIFGSFANQHLNSGDEITLTGQLQINKANLSPGQSIPTKDVRFGIWNKVNPNSGQGTGWLGYMALVASGSRQLGDLEFRNPDDDGFNKASFISNFGVNFLITTFVGPAPTCVAETTCNPDPLTTDNTNVVYQGVRRYIRLAQNSATANLQYNNTYSFNFHIARYGTGDYEIDASVGQTDLHGDYNNDGTVNAADYTLWRDHLGTSFALPNRSPANTGDVSQADYETWRSGFGQRYYSWSVGGGTDFDGVIPTANGFNDPAPSFTSHLSADYNRVGLLFGGTTSADSANLTNVQVSTDTIQTLSLQVNLTTGAANITNTLATPLTIDYYEISSSWGDLVAANWTGIDGTATSPPDGNGWDAAGGASNNVLGEGNLTGSLTLNPGDSMISLGNIFNPATLINRRDLRFYFGLSNGTILRGNVNYSPSSPGAGGGVPEPRSWALLAIASSCLLFFRRASCGSFTPHFQGLEAILQSRKLKSATLAGWSAAVVATGVVAQWVTLAHADGIVPVARWVHLLSVSTHDAANIHTATSLGYDPTTNSPWFGNGTTGSANN
jgi:hypothetical protein